MRPVKLVRGSLVVGLNVVIFYFLIGWCAENIHFESLGREFGRVNPLTIALITGLNLLAVIFYALRLGILLDSPFAISMPATFLGFGLNSALPFRLGEVAKLYYAKRYLLIPTTNLFAATLVEKLFDLGALAALSGIVVVATSITLIDKSVLAALIAVVVLGFAAILGYRKVAPRMQRLAGSSIRIQALISALHKQSRLHHLYRIVAYTVVVWAINVTVLYAGFAGLLPGHTISAFDAIVLLLISALAIAIPTAPAGVGLFEAGVVAYLTQLRGVPNEMALSAAMIFHIAVTVPLFAGLAWVMLNRRSKAAG